MYKYYKVIRFTVGHIFMSFCKLEVFLECRPRIFAKLKKPVFGLTTGVSDFIHRKLDKKVVRSHISPK